MFTLPSRSLFRPTLLSLSCLACTLAAWATTPMVTISSPANASQDSSPVHYIASAVSPGCPKGIASMRIYLAPNISAFTAKSNTLGVKLTLAPGTYNTVVQAWDNCGGIAKSPVNFTVSATGLRPARFLYLTTSSAQNKRIWGYLVNPQTGALTLTKQGAVTGTIGAFAIASDKSGFRLYVMPENRFTNDGAASAYFIDRRNGSLSPVPGSPSSLPFAIGVVAVHPSGKFVYAGALDLGLGNPGVLVFRVNSNGSLTLRTPSPVLTDADPSSMAITPDGKFLYVTTGTSGTFIEAYAIDETSGDITPLPGSPFSLTADCGFAMPFASADLAGRYLYLASGNVSGLSGVAIEQTTGTLQELAGSPFPEPGSAFCQTRFSGLAVDPAGRFLYAGTFFNSIEKFAINAGNGALRRINNANSFGSHYSGSGVLQIDPSGNFLYTFGDSGLPGHDVFDELIGFAIDPSTGALTPVPGSPFTIPTDLAQGFGLVVTP